jgi:CRISPR/Cas system CMR-associated protein Cmr5 small subunit
MSARRIDQGMAAAAAELLPDPVTRELRTRYRQLRIMTRTAGLAGTYAFIASKEGEGSDLALAYRKAAQGIRDRLGQMQLLPAEARQMTAREVLHELGNMDMARYTRASAEAAAFIGWLARLADAAYQDDEGTEAGDRAS